MVKNFDLDPVKATKKALAESYFSRRFLEILGTEEQKTISSQTCRFQDISGPWSTHLINYLLHFWKDINYIGNGNNVSHTLDAYLTQ